MILAALHVNRLHRALPDALEGEHRAKHQELAFFFSGVQLNGKNNFSCCLACSLKMMY